MSVAEILRGKPNRLIGLADGKTVGDAAQLLSQEKIGALIVRNVDGEMIGILSERDIVRAIAAQGPAVIGQPIVSLMTRDVICCAPEDSVAEVMSMMTERRFRHLPVRKDGRLIGMVSIGDVVKARVEEAEGEAEKLREYIAS